MNFFLFKFLSHLNKDIYVKRQLRTNLTQKFIRVMTSMPIIVKDFASKIDNVDVFSFF